MKLQYLGTAAAEAIPAVFCHCDTCRRAREAGGKDIRGRSGLVVDDTALIDFPPDIYMTSLRFGIDLGNIRDIFVTHSHGDHFDMEELGMRLNGVFCHLGEHDDAPGIQVYGNDGAARVTKAYAGSNSTEFMTFTETRFGGRYRAENGTVFTFLPARHMESENSGFYMLESAAGDKRALYAHDTGVFPEETYRLLEGKRFDLISLDCCFGRLSGGISGHMGLPENRQTVARLRQMGCVDERTVIVIHHFSHNCGQLHEELEREVAEDGYLVAYDGMTLTI